MSLINTGPGAKFTRASGAKLDTREKLMRAYDNLPAIVRHALMYANNDWSVEQLTIALNGGRKARGQIRAIPALTPDQCVEMIRKNDARMSRAA